MASSSEPKANPYINKPTKELVEGIDALIERHKKFQTEEVQNAFTAYREECRKPPAIVEYVQKHITDGFNKKQMEVLMAALHFRARSAHRAIPLTMSRFSGGSDNSIATILNANVMEEVGDKGHSPHADLLDQSMYTMGEALNCTSLSRSGFEMARQIMRLRSEASNSVPNWDLDYGTLRDSTYGDGAVKGNLAGTYNAFIKRLEEDGIDIPGKGLRMPEYYFQSAVHVCNLLPPAIDEYFNEIMKMAEVGGDKARPRAIQLLEFATREASSVDEPNRPSYIGAWQKVVETYLGYVERYKRESALGWSKAHNDEISGNKRGWKKSAEEGHAEDARKNALAYLSHLPDANSLAAALREVTRLTESRNKLWQDVIRRMEELDKKDEIITPRPISGKNLMRRLPFQTQDSAPSR